MVLSSHKRGTCITTGQQMVLDHTSNYKTSWLFLSSINATFIIFVIAWTSSSYFVTRLACEWERVAWFLKTVWTLWHVAYVVMMIVVYSVDQPAIPSNNILAALAINFLAISMQAPSLFLHMATGGHRIQAIVGKQKLQQPKFFYPNKDHAAGHVYFKAIEQGVGTSTSVQNISEHNGSEKFFFPIQCDIMDFQKAVSRALLFVCLEIVSSSSVSTLWVQVAFGVIFAFYLQQATTNRHWNNGSETMDLSIMEKGITTLIGASALSVSAILISQYNASNEAYSFQPEETIIQVSSFARSNTCNLFWSAPHTHSPTHFHPQVFTILVVASSIGGPVLHNLVGLIEELAGTRVFNEISETLGPPYEFVENVLIYTAMCLVLGYHKHALGNSCSMWLNLQGSL